MTRNKKYVIAILSICFFVLTIQSVDGRTMEEITSIVRERTETFKIFDDGVTYTKDCLNTHLGEITGIGCSIIHEEIEYPCSFSGSHGSVLSPMCVEIIFKTMENNRK